MMAERQWRDELTELLAALCEERIDAVQTARLERLVTENAEARRLYVEYMHLHAGLSRLVAAVSEPDSSEIAPGPVPPDVQRSVTPPPPLIFDITRSFFRLRVLLAVAAMLLIAVTLSAWMGFRLGRPFAGRLPAGNVGDARAAAARSRPDYIATLARAPGCRWESSQLPTEVGARLFAGRLRLADGQALIEFDSGAQVLVQGPAVLDLQSAMAAQLLSGKVTVDVPEKARGFTINTLSTKIVDLGTAFGVIAGSSGASGPHASELHVLEGVVELEPYSDPSSRGKARVLAGQARRLDSRWAPQWQEIPFDAAKFTREGLAPRRAAGPRRLVDDFDGETLDLARWRTVTAGILPGGARVVQTGGRVELANRGYLVAAEEFDPRVVGPLRICGRWTFNSRKEYLQILTRCGAEPTGDHGETASGIEFNVDVGSDKIGISERLNGQSTPVGGGGFAIKKGDVVDFEILDDGLNLRFTLTKVGGDGATVTASGASGLDFALDYVVFHNRERMPTSRTTQLFYPESPPYQEMVSYLDDVTIEAGGDVGSAAVKAGK